MKRHLRRNRRSARRIRLYLKTKGHQLLISVDGPYLFQATNSRGKFLCSAGLALLGQSRRLSLREQLLRGVAAGSDAVGDTDATIGIAR
jgi:hypothetical protein